MPSIVPGYEYDIFISYRQKDNKRDGWITEFVNTLKDEIEATFKEDISIYFDENPYDGLGETHDVDDSLAKKLKCLIFIPIISKTYCDPNSFAWTNEFLAFNKLASNDEYGIKVNLPNGNTASRVLPIKIHDIDDADKQLVENEIGFLRAIDFVYQSSGVNRPLRAKDDDIVRDASQTFYRDQINKVANAIHEIIAGIKNVGTESSEKEVSSATTNLNAPSIESNPKGKSKILIASIGVILILTLAYFIYNNQNNNKITIGSDHKSIAVLAFDDQSPNGDQEWLGDGVADEILNVLAKVEGLQVTGKTSSFSFKGKDATIKEIGEALDVKTVLEGSVSKVGDKIRITAQLIDVESDKHIWSDRYDRDADDIFAIMDEVAQSIASSLMGELSIEELENIKIGYQVKPEAHEYFLKGIHFHMSNYDFEQSEQMFIKAISIDSSYGEAYAGLADLYDTGEDNAGSSDIGKEYRIKRDSVINVGYNINPNSPYVLVMKGLVFRKTNNLNLDSAFYYYNKAYELDSNHFLVNWTIAITYERIGLYHKSNSLYRKLLKYDPLNIPARGVLARSLTSNGNINEAKEHLKKILEFDKNDYWANKLMFRMALLYNKDTSEAKRIYKTLQQIALNSGTIQYEKALLLAVDGKKEEALSINKSMDIYSIFNMKKEALNLLDSLSAELTYTGNWTYLSLKNIKSFDFIREEPEYDEVLNRAKKVYEERLIKYGHLFDD